MKTMTRAEFDRQRCYGYAGTAATLLPSTIDRWSNLPQWRGHWALSSDGAIGAVLTPVRLQD